MGRRFFFFIRNTRIKKRKRLRILRKPCETDFGACCKVRTKST